EAEKSFEGIESKFSLRTPAEPDEDVCYLVPGQEDTLAHCNFNHTSKTFVVIHGWTVTGMYESWVPKLVDALYRREPDSNVIVVNWLIRAQQHYPVSATYTKLVGKDVAMFIDWMEEQFSYPLNNVHLLGYSLGAHAAGIAGSLTKKKVNRITVTHTHKLSPSPRVTHTCSHKLSVSLFPSRRHTHTHTQTLSLPLSLPLSVSLSLPLSSGDTLTQTQTHSLSPSPRDIHTLAHTRTHSHKLSLSFSSPPSDTHAETLSLFQRHTHTRTQARSLSLYQRHTQTHNQTLCVFFHYQVKIHFFGKINMTKTNQPFLISLYGTLDESENIAFTLPEISSNKTFSFLVYTEVDIGDLLMLKLQWEKDTFFSWSDWWTPFTFDIQRVRVKSGETQKKVVFCSQDGISHLNKGQDAAIFVKCIEQPVNRKK
ncbi:LIPL lipase, partial [Casuarius casuarius]|nr:LIPL lipase [Casuarius casuarius]